MAISCISDFSIAVMKYHYEKQLKEESLFWLTVLEEAFVIMEDACL